MREVIREAIAAVLDDVKLSITEVQGERDLFRLASEAIRSSLREEVPQAVECSGAIDLKPFSVREALRSPLLA